MKRPYRATAILLIGLLASGASLMAPCAAQGVLRLPLKRLLPFPVTTIQIGGRTLDVGVDTGGDGALKLSRQVLVQTGALELPRATDSTTNAYGESQQVHRFRVPEVLIAGRVFRNLTADESPDFQNAPNLQSVAGGLGRGFLQQFVVLLDYPGGMISLLPPDMTRSETQAAGCHGSQAPLQHTALAGLAISSVQLDGATLRLLWDTGAAYSTIPTSSAAAHGLKVDPAPGGPPVYDAPRLLLGGVDLGPLEFAVLPVQLPSEFDGVLGYNLLVHHVVCIDYRRGEVRVR